MDLIKNLTPRELVQGITGYYAHGDSLTMGVVEIEAGSDLPEHSHIHEQITYILEGELDMVIGGKAVALKPGMFYIIPSNTVHGAKAITACKVIDVFSPVREDYRTI
jgi:quercetin dioxygenase-like cupin family protein